MISRVKIKRGQIEDYISDSAVSYVGDVLINNIPVEGYNKVQWDLSHSWGDHAEAGYLTSVEVTNLNINPITHDIADVDGKIIKETVTQLNQPYLDGNNLILKFQNENDVEQTVSVDLSNIITNNSGINNATYNASTNVITLTEEDGDVWTINLSEFSIIPNTDAQGVTTLTQENTVKLTVSKVGQTGEYADLLNIPDTIDGISVRDVNGVEQFHTDAIQFEGVTFDAINNRVSVIQQLLTFDIETGDLSLSEGNTINLDDRYSKNPIAQEGEQYFISQDGTNQLTSDYPVKRGQIVENQEEFDSFTYSGTSEYIFWMLGDSSYNTYEYSPSTSNFELQNPQTTFASTHFGVSRFVYTTQTGKTYYITEQDTIIQIGSNVNNYDHWNLSLNGANTLPINSKESINFKDGSNISITRENNDVIFSGTNNYIKSVTGDGNSSLTIEREGLSNIVHDLSHNHDGVYATESRVDAIEEDKNFVYTQTTPSTQWVITHNLEKYPSVSIVDDNNNTLWTEVVYTDINTITINFNSAMSGTVTLN